MEKSELKSETEFYSHPKENKENEGSKLIQHSLRTANRAKFLTENTGLSEAAFYAGLFHDLGKLNPYYQILFSSEPTNRERLRPEYEKYLRAHSFFSSLAAYRLTQSTNMSLKTKMQILLAVCGHHSRIAQFGKSLGIKEKSHFGESLKGTLDNLSRFSEQTKKIAEFKELNWDLCLKQFRNIPLLDPYISEDPENVALDYLDFCSVFSALLQSDRGSFFDWNLPNYTINFDTRVLIREGPLSELRQEFQEKVLKDNSFEEKIMVLEAPTGIGKTKIFLDIVNKSVEKLKIRRVFYFSPLLALTEDFEGKLFNVLKLEDLEKVLVYNHTFVGSLLKEKNRKEEESSAEEPFFFKTKEYFESESFNKELIITTTQRLLMTLYSDAKSDKMKLLSFKDSYLIIDEVQTIPKFLLPNLIALLRTLAEKYNARILLVSATVPEQMKSLKVLNCPKDVCSKYLERTSKKIEYRQGLDAFGAEGSFDKVLYMANTKRKTRKIFESVSENTKNVRYLSTGISKRQRKTEIAGLANTASVTVVSTQVLEAGVDVSFDRIFREIAPLDNIIQAMGRLNREGKNKSATLSVFKMDDSCKPYSELEVEISKQIISQVTSSQELYDRLPEYYQLVNSRNQRNISLAFDLESKMSRLEFDEVWKFIKDYVLPAEVGDSVLVPDAGEYDLVKRNFVSKSSERKGELYRLYADRMAELPRSVEDLNLEDLFDEELLRIGVLLPKKACLSEVYDEKIGLDKWVKM